MAREGAIHEGIVEFFNDNVVFKILSNSQVVKLFKGDYNTLISLYSSIYKVLMTALHI